MSTITPGTSAAPLFESQRGSPISLEAQSQEVAGQESGLVLSVIFIVIVSPRTLLSTWGLRGGATGLGLGPMVPQQHRVMNPKSRAWPPQPHSGERYRVEQLLRAPQGLPRLLSWLPRSPSLCRPRIPPPSAQGSQEA